MRVLDRKLLRDLKGLWGQALAIALVIAGGVATLVMAVSTLDALSRTQSQFYRETAFAQVFVTLKRAPRSLERRIRELPGVARLETRVIAPATLDVAGFAEPVTARLISLPEGGPPGLNRLHLQAGRRVAPGRDDEVVISEAFAEAQGLGPGDRLGAIVNGRSRTLSVVGVALSPEYVIQIQPGALFPDFKRFGVLWMNRDPLASAYDMAGAFNDLSLSLVPGSEPRLVIEALDRLLEPYGGLGAYERTDQLSHRYLSEEMKGLEQTATLLPVIFLGVAAFLLNVVVARLIALQREQIAALKAFGYRNREVATHYIKLVAVIVLAGVAIGVGAGTWLGQGLAELYRQFYRFPYLVYQLAPGVLLLATGVSLAAALGGTLTTVARAVALPPAQAMAPEPPARYRVSWLERLGLGELISPLARMILRNLQRRPFKALLSVIGIALAGAILVLGAFQGDAIQHMMTVQFSLIQREDLTVTFTQAADRRALHELQTLEGVYHAEPFRAVAVRLRAGHRHYRTALQGLPPTGRLQRLLDADLEPIRLPPAGVVLTDHLGRRLGVTPGDQLAVEVLEGGRPVRRVTVAALVSQYVGVGAYMDIEALNRLLREGPTLSGALLAVDERHLPTVYARLKDSPGVAGVTARASALNSFKETIAENQLIFATVNTLLAIVIAFGVVYNTARVALSERARELASLRVLGFRRGEVAYILLGELALLTGVAILVGFVLGRGLCAWLVAAFESDLYRIPLVIEPSTYAFAATVILASALASGLLVWRRLARLDLVGVLKARE